MDGNPRQLHIPGSFQKKVWIAVGDIVLISLREYEDSKADVIHKYAPDHVKRLRQLGEIPDVQGGGKEEEELPFEFEEADLDTL